MIRVLLCLTLVLSLPSAVNLLGWTFGVSWDPDPYSFVVAETEGRFVVRSGVPTFISDEECEDGKMRVVYLPAGRFSISSSGPPPLNGWFMRQEKLPMALPWFQLPSSKDQSFIIPAILLPAFLLFTTGCVVLLRTLRRSAPSRS